MSLTKDKSLKENLIIKNMPQGFALHEVVLNKNKEVVDYVFLNVNSAFEEMTGLQKEDIIGKSVKEVLPQTEQYWIDTYGKVALTGENVKFENYSKEFKKYYQVVAYSPKKKQFITIFTEITEQKTNQKKLERINKKLNILSKEYNKLFHNTQDCIFLVKVIDGNKFKYIRTNTSHQKLTGIALSELRGKTPTEVVGDKQGKLIEKKYLECVKKAKSISYEEVLTLKSGTQIWHTTLNPIIENGKVINIVGSSHDITGRKQMEEKIKEMSLIDQLTGLYNRRYYEHNILNAYGEKCLPLSILLMDVNGLKLVNDAFGHKYGDLILTQIATILKNNINAKEGFAARIGGDEFIVVLPSHSLIEAKKVADNIKQNIDLQSKENQENLGIMLSASIGLATRESIKQNPEETFKAAEDSMYRHKLAETASVKSKTIDIILNTLYEKGEMEMLHSRRVSELSSKLASALGLDKEKVDEIRLAGLMHDIGKIGIPEQILNKPGKLTDEEYEIIKKHSEAGYRILKASNEFYKIAIYVLQHHERIDGKGYPYGLTGEEITLPAKIIAIADAYDAMTSTRSYREAKTKEYAISQLLKYAGTQFDENLVKVFIEKVI